MASDRGKDLLLNAALVVGGVLVLVLLYGFLSRATLPGGASIATPPGEHSQIQVEVRNGAGVDGLAARATRYLRGQGFDVVDLGNAPPQDTTTVLVRSGTALDAETVAEALGLGAERVVTGGPVTDYALDVTVTLGADHHQLAPFADE